MVPETSLPRPPIDANLNDEMSGVPSGSDDGHAKGGRYESSVEVSKRRNHWSNGSSESLIHKEETKAQTTSDPSARTPSSLPPAGSGSSGSASWASPARFPSSSSAKLGADGDTEGRGMLFFDVKDTGSGVADELKPRLFRAFTQLQSMPSMQSNGGLQRDCAVV